MRWMEWIGLCECTFVHPSVEEIGWTGKKYVVKVLEQIPSPRGRGLG